MASDVNNRAPYYVLSAYKDSDTVLVARIDAGLASHAFARSVELVTAMKDVGDNKIDRFELIRYEG